MTKEEYLEKTKGLEGEALFRQTMDWLSLEDIADHDLDFTAGPMEKSVPELTLHFLDEDGNDTREALVLLLVGSVAAISEER